MALGEDLTGGIEVEIVDLADDPGDDRLELRRMAYAELCEAEEREYRQAMNYWREMNSVAVGQEPVDYWREVESVAV